MRVSVTVLSGLGRKAAAAILVDYKPGGGARPVRFLLDAGGALEVGEDKGWRLPDNLDAIFISHDHQDHMGGLKELQTQVPVYASVSVQQQLPGHLNLKTLPVCGTTYVSGIKVTTGSAGHSFGGVWLHLAMADGVFYSGDFSLESCLYPFTMPPTAGIALLDASYGLYDNSLAQCKQSLLSYLEDERALLMPVPQTGRALEMACWLTSIGFDDWSLGDDCIRPDTVLAAPEDSVFPAMRALLQDMKQAPFDPNAKVVLCGDPDAMGGDAAVLLAQPEKYLPVYTGHLPEHAKQAVSEDRAYFARWNVHPRKQDLRDLISHLGCDVCVPLFHSIKDEQAWRTALGPSITFHSFIEQDYDVIA